MIDQDNENLFTLVLLVKGRDNFSVRWLKYMDQINFKYPIVIADGANDGFLDNLIRNYSYKNKLNITFKQFDTNSGFKSYYEMKRDTLKEIKTKYVMICDNDDFIIKSGLDEILNFLNNNDEFVSASGKILNFEINNRSYETYGNFYFLPTYNYSRLTDPLSNWTKQIEMVFTKFQPNFYNVYRKNILLKIFEETTELNFSDLTINEFFIQLRANILGKSKILDVHHYLRQRGTSQISNDFDFTNDLMSKDLPKDYRRLNEYISQILSNEAGEDKTKLTAIFEKSFSNYLKNIIAGTMLKFRFPRLYKIKMFIKILWLEKIKTISSKVKKIKNNIFLKKIKNKTNKEDLIEIIKFLKKES